MTQEEYGLYGYFISIILTFSIVLNFGLYIPLSKLYHDLSAPADRGKLLYTLFVMLTIGLFCSLFPIYFFGLDYTIIKILFKNPINYNAYRYTLLLAIIVSVCNFMLTNFFFTSEKINHIKRYNIWRIICINVFSLGFLYYFQNKDTVGLRLEVTYIVEGILFLLFAVYPFKEFHFTFNKALVKNSIKLALPVMFSAIFGIFINFSDKFFLEKYNSFADLSYYYLAISVAGVIPVIFVSFQNAWLPLFLKEKDVEKNVLKTNKLIFQLSIVFISISLLLILALKMTFIFGIIQEKYHEALSVLPILLLSQIVAAIVPIYTNYLIYFSKTYITPVTGIIICFINVGLNIVLIPRYGPYGAATVSLISNSAYLVIYYFITTNYIKKHIAVKPAISE
jgi:O-antigen/teichoic acid export membrane protein